MKSKTIFQAVCHLNLNHSISAESWKQNQISLQMKLLTMFFQNNTKLNNESKTKQTWIYQILSEKSRTQVTESNLSWCESIFSLNPFERNPNPFEGNPNPNPFEVFESYKRYESESICESESIRESICQKMNPKRGFWKVQAANPNPNPLCGSVIAIPLQ